MPRIPPPSYPPPSFQVSARTVKAGRRVARRRDARHGRLARHPCREPLPEAGLRRHLLEARLRVRADDRRHAIAESGRRDHECELSGLRLREADARHRLARLLRGPRLRPREVATEADELALAVVGVRELRA